MHLYEVGQLYHPGRTSWPEAVEYSYRGGEHQLLLFWPHPTAGEIKGVRAGAADFGLLVRDQVIFLMFRFEGGCRWSDSPYSWWREKPEDRQMPNPEPGAEERILLHTVLVDSATGIIKVLRASSLSPRFSAALHKAIREQAGRPIDDDTLNAAIARVQQRYPDSVDMLRDAIATCRGGD